jgi:hypothetical protein
MSTTVKYDAKVRESHWIFSTPQYAQHFEPRTPFVGAVGVPVAREQLQPNNFQWLVYKPQSHAIPPFSYYLATRNPGRQQ